MVMRELQTSQKGLTEAQAIKRLGEVGENRIRERGRKAAWRVFLEQFQDLLVLILIAAAGISAISGDVESTVVIVAVITMNAVLGTVQHEKAQNSLDSLKQMTSPEARVMRDGQTRMIDSVEVVPGDILILKTGDRAAADGRLLECHGLRMDESALTGESEPVEKCLESGLQAAEAMAADQKNMIFAGSLVTAGRGIVVVTDTGMQTELGRIASMMNDTGERRTPLQVSLDRFSGHLAAGILLICAVVFGLSIDRGTKVLDSLVFAVALAVAAIPEALGSIVTIVQAMGTQQMAREHAIIKDLKAVESLGCISVICSDKTGTLTQNRMHVREIWAGGKLLHPGELHPEIPMHRYLLLCAALNNDTAQLADTGELMGEPTERALAVMLADAGLSYQEYRDRYPRLAEIPFDSGRKYMETRHRIDGEELWMVKGALDVLLERSGQIYSEEGIRLLSEHGKRRIREQNQRWSEQGMRVLALACRFGKEPERRFVWLGMAAITDPPRPESRAAVAAAARAGIRTVMITGDHRSTAEAIAREIGIFRDGDEVVSGAELDHLDDQQLDLRLERISVYARVAPIHKIRIVEAWQRRGKLTAMLGDGVNDAPALKKADIGVAMGLNGTDVSREAADMILTDDNFASVIKAVSNGRNVYRNICHAISFLLSGNMAGILCVLYTSLRALPMPFAPVHLLFINLLTDSLPAIAIGMEPPESGLLDRPPRDPAEGILTRAFLYEILLQGGLMAVCTMCAYYQGILYGGAGTASTMAFATLTLARLFHGFNCRSEQPMIRLGLMTNQWMLMAFETGVVLLAAVLFLPGLQVMFAAADLMRQQLVMIGTLAFLPTAMIQMGKMIQMAVH